MHASSAEKNTQVLATWVNQIACPVCHSHLLLTVPDFLTCSACSRTYPITDGIPILIPNRTQTESIG